MYTYVYWLICGVIDRKSVNALFRYRPTAKIATINGLKGEMTKSLINKPGVNYFTRSLDLSYNILVLS